MKNYLQTMFCCICFWNYFLRVVFKLKYCINFSVFWWPLKIICDLKLGRDAYRRNAGVDRVTENTVEPWALWVRFEPLAPTDPLVFPVPLCHGASFVVFRGRPTARTFDLDGIYRRVYTRVHGVSANTPYSHWNAKGFENPNKAFFSILLCLRPSFLFPIRHVTRAENRSRHRRQR